MKWKLPILLLIAAFLAGSVWSAPAPRPRAKRQRDGDYNLQVAGYAKGMGIAAVQGDKLLITVAVVSESGAAGTFTTTDVTIQGDHFTGAGTLLGEKATIRGRIDAPEFDKEKAIKKSRIIGTAKSDGGNYVRFIGELPGSGMPTGPIIRPPGPTPGPNPGPNPRPVPPKPGDDDDGHKNRANSRSRR